MTRSRACASPASVASHACQLGCRTGREHLVRAQDLFGDREQGRVGEALGHHHAGEITPHLVDGLIGNPVEHHGDGCRPAGRLPQVAPRHSVGIPGSRRDEDPHVRSREQPVGQFAVGLDHRIDVRRVQEAKPRRQSRCRHQPQAGSAGLTVGASDASQAGEHLVGGAEPLGVVGVVHEDRKPSRGAEHPGSGHDLADERVGERRLARAGGSADDRQHRSVETGEPRKEVVVELGESMACGPIPLQPRQLWGAAGGCREARPAPPSAPRPGRVAPP